VTPVVASTVVAALVDSGDDGSWADGLLADSQLAAPHLMPVEVASILRWAVLADDVSADGAALTHADLLDLRAELFACDAWYVAVAEALNVALATLDRRLASASGTQCAFVTPTIPQADSSCRGALQQHDLRQHERTRSHRTLRAADARAADVDSRSI
jgi:predicted nucleic acid-binding protein